ncbi:enoyl-CoA hydratase/isomerase family protein [Streptomyces sp. NPDC090075]|uniref:enoyl-CoA hydratase/isomerase family protein n=1 Tax=Streptomyces sp. NPDC090075 TaxID=3365937 RepID=UPI0038151D40
MTTTQPATDAPAAVLERHGHTALITGAGGAIRLPRVIPRSTALAMLLTGEPITAATAELRGLVNRVAPVAAGAPLALGSVKRLVHASPGLDPTGKPSLGPPTTPSGSESAPVRTPRRIPEPSWRSASRDRTHCAGTAATRLKVPSSGATRPPPEGV